MIYLLIIFILIIFAFIWIYFAGIRIKAIVRIQEGLCADIFWKYPFLRGTFKLEDTIPLLQIYIFNIRIVNHRIISKHGSFNLKRLVKSIDATKIRVKMNYGLNDPFQTGILCGALNILSSFLDIEEIIQVPDFLAQSNYVRIEAEALINVRHSILNFAKTKNKKEIYQWSKT